MRSLFLALAILAAAALPAAASGSFSCRASDASVRFTAGSPVSRGMGGNFFDFRASLRIASGEVARDLRSSAFGRSDLVHSWFGNGELRLHLYRERTASPHGYVELTVLTRAAGEESYRGSYVLTVYDTAGSGAEGRRTVLRGNVTCSVE